jgi:hypothetical protein
MLEDEISVSAASQCKPSNEAEEFASIHRRFADPILLRAFIAYLQECGVPERCPASSGAGPQVRQIRKDVALRKGPLDAWRTDCRLSARHHRESTRPG